MSVALQHSPADIVAWLLVNNGLGGNPEADSLPAWPVYVGGEPGSPDNAITVYDTTPRDNGRSMIDGERYLHHGIQVRVRARTRAEAAAKAYSLARALSEAVALQRVTIAGSAYTVHSFDGATPLSLGKETPTSKRSVWTVNGTVSIRAE